MFKLPDHWQSFVLRDPAGNSIISGSGSTTADFSSVLPGRYSLTSSESSSRYHLLLAHNIPGRVLAATQNADSSVSFSFDGSGYAGPYLVSVQNSAGAVQQSFYIYSAEASLNFQPGEWRLVIAKPGEAGFSFSISANSDASLQSFNNIGVTDDADWFLNSLSVGLKVDNFASNLGPVTFKFTDQVNPEHIVQVRDPGTGTISTWFTDDTALTVGLGIGRFEWRVLGMAQRSVPYPDLFAGLNSIQGNWSPFTQRFDNQRTKVGLFVPSDMAAYVVRTPEGNSVAGDSYGRWIDLSSLTPGRYSLTGEGLNGAIREELIIDDSIIGGALSVRGSNAGNVRLKFEDSSPAPYYVTVKRSTGDTVTAFYHYSTVLDLTLDDGSFVVSIAESGSAGFSTQATLAGGRLASVNRVATSDSLDWYVNVLSRGDPFGPIGGNNGITNFTFDAGAHKKFIVQIRDPNTGTIGTYQTAKPELAVALGNGDFQWRAFGSPEQLVLTPSVISRISMMEGGWTSFEQLAGRPAIDYVLGREPDRVKYADDLIFNYPADALLLSDGSMVVTNTYGASVLRILPDGSIQRLAGGDREGYTESGFGQDVLLRGPGQLYDNGDGTILFTDTRNFVVREINLETGYVRTVLGNPEILQPALVDGQLLGLGDIYDVGRDNRGKLFVTAASTIKVGDQLYSSSTYMLRQNDLDEWYVWDLDTRGLTEGSFKFIDVLFHDNIVSILAHDGPDKRYLKFSQDGELLGQVKLGPAYGGGMVLDPISGDLLIGNHTAMVRLDWETLQASDHRFPETLANVSFMNRNGDQIALVDSDRGKVYRYDLASGSIVDAYGQSSRISNVVVDLEATANGILALDNQTPRIIAVEEGRVSPIAGTGEQGFASSGLKASESSFYFPNAISRAEDGSIYVVEANHRIMKIAADGALTGFAGGFESGYSGDGGLAINARFQSIYGIDATPDGKLYVADSYNHAIRLIGADGKVRTLAGNGQAGIGSSPHDSSLNTPQRVLVTSGGRILISDSWNNRVVEMASDGTLIPFAGVGNYTVYQGSGNFFGDGGAAMAAGLNTPVGIAFHEGDGTLYIADSFNNRVRYVDSAGNIHTLIGADRGYAYGQLLNLPSDVALVGDDLYIADTGNALVLKLAGVDRTGDDLSNSLDVGKAIVRSGISNRSEYTDSGDLDFYNLTSVASRNIILTALDDGVVVAFTNGDHNYYGGRRLALNESVVIDPGVAPYFAVSAEGEEKRRYNIEIVDAPTQMVNFNDSDTRIALMTQAMAGFAPETGTLPQSSGYPEPPRYDWFA